LGFGHASFSRATIEWRAQIANSTYWVARSASLLLPPGMADHVVIAAEPGSGGRQGTRSCAIRRCASQRHFALPCEPARGPGDVSLFMFIPNSEVWILVLVVVDDQSEAFSAAKRARLSRNYFVQLV